MKFKSTSNTEREQPFLELLLASITNNTSREVRPEVELNKTKLKM